MSAAAALKALMEEVSYLTDSERDSIGSAADIATTAHKGQTRENGEPYIIHPLSVALILAKWQTDAETIIAGILHDTLEDTQLTPKKIETLFGGNVLPLVEGVTKFTQADFEGQEAYDRKIETLRKLFDVMNQDIRVAIIKLADRLHNMRTAKDLPEQRRMRFARETMDVYYNLALHLGMNKVRRELGELCLHILYPQESERLMRERENIMKRDKPVIEEVRDTIADHDKTGALKRITMKPRSLYALHKNELQDRHDEPPYIVVVTAKTVDDCYELLKVFHTVYQPISGRFRDYIAVPTESGYQSIRTTVVGPDGRLLPIRIRTEEMHKQEKAGILEKFYRRDDVPGFSWLQRLEKLDKQTKLSSEEFWKALQTDILQENIRINVNGNVRSLPEGSTVLDAMYDEFGKEANRVNHVMVNGHEEHLWHRLEQDDIVSAKLSSRSHMTFDWTKWVTTSYARNLITEALRHRSKHEKLIVGQRLLQKELDHFRKGLIGELSKQQKQIVAQRFKRQSFEDVIIMIGEGVLRPEHIVFTLFPEHEPGKWSLRRRKQETYPFRIRIRGTSKKQGSVLPHILGLAKSQNITVTSTGTSMERGTDHYVITLRGVSPDRLHFADFLSALEIQDHVSSVDALMSTREKLFVLGCITFCSGIIALDVLLLPFFATLPITQVLMQIMPMIPILLANLLLLRVLQHFIVTVRTDKWIIGLYLALNFAGIFLLMMMTHIMGTPTLSLLPLLSIFVLSMFYVGIRFFQHEAVFTDVTHERTHSLSASEWRALKRKKIIGYGIRLLAVIVWGAYPLYVKHTPTNEVAPLARVFLISAGALLVTVAILLASHHRKPPTRRKTTLKDLPKNTLLYGIIASQALYLYFANFSLLFTSSTNFLLLNNFSPVFALLVAAMLWRQSIPYLKKPQHILAIFALFFLGSTGGTLIIYNSILTAGGGTVQGDVLGLFAMACDTWLVISQIRYVKHLPRVNGTHINTHVFGVAALILMPYVLYLGFSGLSQAHGLLSDNILWALGAGAILGGGQLLNYEAFKRVDGFIAFLMFNISIFITFSTEVFILKTFEPTMLLVLGGLIIVASTIGAEVINGRCQKEGL